MSNQLQIPEVPEQEMDVDNKEVEVGQLSLLTAIRSTLMKLPTPLPARNFRSANTQLSYNAREFHSLEAQKFESRSDFRDAIVFTHKHITKTISQLVNSLMYKSWLLLTT
ncbi:unnamed protein product [Rhizophagus irregularis]|nr:unnamed protein product [Rhizophagus irregularis]